MAVRIPQNYRVRIMEDPDPDLSWLDQPDYLTEPVYPTKEDGDLKINPITPDAYVDHNNHAACGAVLEKKCSECGKWDHVDSLWGIDYYIGPGSNRMDGPPEIGTYTVLDAITDEYMRSIVVDMIKDAP